MNPGTDPGRRGESPRLHGGMLAVATLVLALPTAAVATPPAVAVVTGDQQCAATVELGTSRLGDSIAACQVRGSDPAQPAALVVGSMHGDEPGGLGVITRLLASDLARRSANLWVIRTINPDGIAAGTRGNSRGVDLNGNFPTKRWRVRFPGTARWGGSRAASEPETRALMAAMTQLRPTVVVVLHQQLNLVDCPPYRGGQLTRRLHELTGYRMKCLPVYVGNFTAWANRKYRWTTTVTFELEARPSGTKLDRVAAALVDVASR